MRKKRQRPQERELFPGAGYWLDWENLALDSFDIVEKRLGEIGPREEQILHLRMLGEHFEQDAGHDADLVFLLVKAPNVALDPEIEEHVAHVRVFRDRLKRKLQQLRNLLEIEKQKSGEASRTEGGEKEAEDEHAGPQWNNGALAVAIYAMLRAAGLPDKPNKSAIARFAQKLTGRSEQNLRDALYDAIGGTFDKKTADEVAEQFEKIGLLKVAADVRKNFT